MKKLLLSLSFLFFIAACTTEQYGSGVNNEIKTVQVKDVIINQSYQGKTVNLEGIIISQCGTEGCWLHLHDGTGQIYINMKPNSFSVPPKQGKKAKVTGVVMQNDDGVQIIASGVEVS
jgi:uncharacterized protein YdeI (BOF family)